MIEWYYRDNLSRQVGPLTDAEFSVCVTVGEIRPTTRVWRSGLTGWTTYAALCAEEDAPGLISRSRSARRSPASTTFCAQIALGLSRIHQPPAQARITSSGSTACGITEPLPEERDVTGLLQLSAEPERGECDPRWLGRQFVRIALAGAALLLAHTFFVHRAAALSQESPLASKLVAALKPER